MNEESILVGFRERDRQQHFALNVTRAFNLDTFRS